MEATEAIRIDAREVHQRVSSGKAFFVCGYEEDEKYESLRLQMSMPYSEFSKKVSGLAKDQEIIFYCA